jgi:hypothetical protein
MHTETDGEVRYSNPINQWHAPSTLCSCRDCRDFYETMDTPMNDYTLKRDTLQYPTLGALLVAVANWDRQAPLCRKIVKIDTDALTIEFTYVAYEGPMPSGGTSW